MKYLKTATFLCLSLVSCSALADFLLTKNADSNAIYRINVTTSDDKLAVVDVKASFGKMQGANCHYTKLINIGKIAITNSRGTTYGITNNDLKNYVGNSYTCGKLTFDYNQIQEKEFELHWDGKNYIASNPSSSAVAFE